MRFELNFNMDNDIFQVAPEREIQKILLHTHDLIEAGRVYGLLIDSNGNSIGRWDINLEEGDV